MEAAHDYRVLFRNGVKLLSEPRILEDAIERIQIGNTDKKDAAAFASAPPGRAEAHEVFVKRRAAFAAMPGCHFNFDVVYEHTL